MVKTKSTPLGTSHPTAVADGSLPLAGNKRKMPRKHDSILANEIMVARSLACSWGI
jgi:hypothetical protein